MKNNTIVTIGIALLVLAAAWGTMRATVANNSNEIRLLQAESDQRMSILQKVDTSLQLVIQQLRNHEAKKDH